MVMEPEHIGSIFVAGFLTVSLESASLQQETGVQQLSGDPSAKLFAGLQLPSMPHVLEQVCCVSQSLQQALVMTAGLSKEVEEGPCSFTPSQALT